ncbi:LEAF RUST 10 DISEASE-RESISTANCE LOCUS RECEPTOR-LIKE PROTEIN KINASE-like 2.8 [Thalictrum thalictroides]|uniref:LEAF RUST 10 DISEASE-RESISTANCE LOCUS RECEPTOR-LIKE PROTEIN KINASE-like 2.8 n=1 Tax=Thalictrum thalictroides TaxID=46969 RepID=A0A7J6WDC3_THATH|nr:LEAF RUST 10 DISEASE-RESISTANCE LOCUS RECEPTOR-LIKE PROTEIN KINASE-like 2.8 [Thalictrum thalictroides]
MALHLHHLSILYYYLLLFFISLFFSSIKSQQQTTPTPVISTDPSFYYNLCSPSRCNNLSLPYPFALPTPCHPSNLQPLCPTNQSLLLTSQRTSDTFRVLSINLNTDPTTTTFSVASDSLFTCGAQVSRPNFASDASVFSIGFGYTPGTHLNCTAPIPSNSIRGLQNASCLGCNGQDPTNVCYYAPGFVAYDSCETFHTFTPNGSFNASSVSDLRAYLRSGFQIRYVKPLDCRGCESSGGRCGAQPTTGSSVCYCPSSVHQMNCSDGMQEDLSTWVNGQGGGSGLSKAAVAGISASASVLFLIIAVALVVILVRRRKKNIHFNKETISSISPTRRKNYDPEAGDSSQVYFPEWLYNKVERDEFPSLMRGGEGVSSFEIIGDEEDEKAVQRMCLVGLWCIQHIPSNRPNMDKVVQMLEGHVEIGIPPHPFPQNAPKSHESSSQDALV